MLNRLALVTAASTVLLLFAGGLVTTTNSGDAVPDWWFAPISFGTLLPEMKGGVLYEHGHRLVATVVGVLTIVMAVALWRRDPRPWLRTLGWLALGAVCAQGILGGARVLKLASPAALAIIHASFAQVFFAMIVAIATATSRTWETDRPDPEPSGVPKLALWTAGACYLQIVLGAWRRHTGKLIHVHLLVATVLLVLILVLAAECLKRGRFRRTVSTLAALILAQLVLGAWTWALMASGFARSHLSSKPEILVITAHLALGGLIWGLLVSVAVRSRRVWPASRPSAPSAEGLPA
ncbi:MAG: COX15/CtaA family protein [Candidatus Brocadiae bacterium]|nr:COX15/CtaA family protein [Candidatus Brocadiia bacterium]